MLRHLQKDCNDCRPMHLPCQSMRKRQIDMRYSDLVLVKINLNQSYSLIKLNKIFDIAIIKHRLRNFYCGIELHVYGSQKRFYPKDGGFGDMGLAQGGKGRSDRVMEDE